MISPPEDQVRRDCLEAGGSEVIRRPQPCILVLFGATGDLARRKLGPALFSLARQGLLPERYSVIAYARRSMSDDAYRTMLRAGIEQLSGVSINAEAEWDRFAGNVHYHTADLDDPAGYESLRSRIETECCEHGIQATNRLYYLATPPEQFAAIAERLGAAGLVQRSSPARWDKIVVEKPFGLDLDSARRLNRHLQGVFDEDQIYRIDHYLGKETVQNIQVMRFANSLFELLWNHLYIDHVQITVAETLGVEGRAPYFDRSGITRDIVQNHVLQLLSLVAMEPPVNLTADAVRDEKVKVLRSVRRMGPDDYAIATVRGAYAANKGMAAYTDEPGVGANSRTETYVAMKLHVDNWRWAGVPFYVRAGKRLPARATEVVLQLRAVPDVLFARMECMRTPANRIVLRIQPNEGVEIHIGGKPPGPRMEVRPMSLQFSYAQEFGTAIPDAYERLLLNAMLGDAALFARDDEVEEAWSIISPLLDAWDGDQTEPELYRAGSWGPSGADRMLSADGRRWWNPGEV